MPEGSSREFRPDLEREFQYLLGQMPRVDRETFQGLLIENPEVSDRVLEAENELFDAWARGDLPRDWRPMFEERLLATSEGRRKGAAARTLAARVAQKPASGNWARPFAAMVPLAAAAGFWLWWQGRNGDAKPLREHQQQQQQIARAETLRLEAGARPSFRIAASTSTVRFGITEAASASAELATLEGRIIWKGAASETLPVSLLAPGLYRFTTFDGAGAAANRYEFEIAGQ